MPNSDRIIMFHYTYRITNIILNKHYYGARTSKHEPKDDIGVKYFSSSKDKDFIKDQHANPQHYKYKVICVCKNRERAIKLEIKLHNKFNVGVNESFYNRSKQTSIGWDTSGISSTPMWGENNPMFGKTHSIDAVVKIKAARAKQGSDVWNSGRHGLYSLEYKQAISDSVRGRKFMIHPVTKHVTHARPEMIDQLLKDGYVFGMKLKDPAPISIG